MSSLTDIERKRVQNYLSDAGDKILSTTEALASTQLAFRPRHDRWSIAEIIEHLTIVDRLVLGQITEVLELPGCFKESSWKGEDDALLRRVRCPEPVMKAPDIIAPHADESAAEILLHFATSRSRLSEFVGNTNAPLRSYCFPHPVLGELDCYQWLLCSGAHYERHLLQIAGVMRTPDFPIGAS